MLGPLLVVEGLFTMAIYQLSPIVKVVSEEGARRDSVWARERVPLS